MEIRFPAELPITERLDDIAAAVEANPVVVVVGDTGSGKSTQLPKLCLAAGRGVDGMIGHTQPRRIAARSIAERVAAELGTGVGGLVGYQVRFTDRVSDATRIKVMTDGILLAEIHSDPDLAAYDTLIIDEAHERSLNIDFLVGYLHRLRRRRPDLRVIITSATIDATRIADHFDGAPVIEVAGRLHPVEIRYRPVAERDDGDPLGAVCDAVRELCAEGPGDILVFESGEREIRDTIAALAELGLDAELLPLYGRLSVAEQHRVFAPRRGRRIVVATNVAETSLTVPGIRAVVDTGTARVSRYHRRAKVQRLHIEPIPRASADQRAGRCGRVGPGVCIRLYSEEDLEARPAFADPEILRTNLASVLLRMADLDLGAPEDFPFLDAPDPRAVRDGLRLLAELGAIRGAGRRRRPGEPVRLTPLGRRLARLPADPRLGRMVLEAERFGCVHEVMVIAAALSIQDPRQWPTDQRAAAEAAHARFRHPDSDVLGWLALWNHLRDRRRELSGNQLRRLCRQEFLHYLRIREWQDLYTQLRTTVRALGIGVNTTPAEPDAIHRSLLAGLLSHVGVADPARPGEYRGARGIRFRISRRSVLAGSNPRWVMAAELIDTGRIWASTVAPVDPAWLEDVGSHLVRRRYDEPWWDPAEGRSVSREHVTLLGLPVADRRVDWRRVDRADARRRFIRHALVDGDWDTDEPVIARNRRRIATVAELERRARRSLLADDDRLVAFFDERLPDEVASGRDFTRWWRTASREDPRRLDLPASVLLADRSVRPGDFPDTWPDAPRVRLRYHDDGSITALVPLTSVGSLDPDAFTWQVPGNRAELATALVRTLPKAVRRALGPAPQAVAGALERLGEPAGPFPAALARALTVATGVDVDPGDLDPDRVPANLRIRFEIHDDGRVVATGDDLARLAAHLAEQAADRLTAALGDIPRGPDGFPLGGLPDRVTVTVGGATVVAHPALVPAGDGVTVRAYPTAAAARAATRRGVRRLVMAAAGSPVREVARLLDQPTRLALAGAHHDTVAGILGDCVAATIDALVAAAGGPPTDPGAWAELRAAARHRLVDDAAAVTARAARLITTAAGLRDRAEGLPGRLADQRADICAHLDRLVRPGFVTDAGVDRLDDIERYLAAVEHRLDRLGRDPAGDADRLPVVRRLEAALEDLAARWPPDADRSPLVELRWMLEELRVQLFAEHLGTRGRVSARRIQRALEAARPRPGA